MPVLLRVIVCFFMDSVLVGSQGLPTLAECQHKGTSVLVQRGPGRDADRWKKWRPDPETDLKLVQSCSTAVRDKNKNLKMGVNVALFTFIFIQSASFLNQTHSIESKHEVTILGGLNEFVVKFFGPQGSKCFSSFLYN